MRKLSILLLLTIVSCKNGAKNDEQIKQHLIQLKQQKAEETVLSYLHIPKNSDTAKHMKFTQLDLRLHRIGLKDGFKDYIGPKHLLWTQVLFFDLDSSLNKVRGELTE